MKTRIYDNALGFVFGLSLMGLFAIWQAGQIGRWERLYWEQDFEISVHKHYGTEKDRLARRLLLKHQQQQQTIAKLTSELGKLTPEVAAAAAE